MSRFVRWACVAAGVVTAAALGAAPATMMAARIHAYGDASALRYEETARPTPGPGELLVRVHAAGVNPVDWKIRRGMFRTPEAAFPMTLGYDVSGVVESVGAAVESFKPGDEVFAYLSLQRGGGYAEFAIVLEAEAAKKPASIDHAHAAGVPLAALTAWQALFDHAGMQEGDTVLIHGGAGGVGHFAVQIAKAKGATVITTASERNHEYLRSIGADVVVDYRTQRFEEFASGVDIVLDVIGGETQDRSLTVLKPDGFLVSIVQPPAPEKLDRAGVRGSAMLVRPHGEQLAMIAAMIDAGEIRPHVSATFPLKDAAAAHEASEAGAERGKIVLIVP